MRNEKVKLLASLIIVSAFILFIFTVIKALGIVDRTQVSTEEGVYTSYVTTSKEIEEKAKYLTRVCQTKLCKVQRLLDFTTQIPYRTNTFQKKSPQKTIQENFGDCDDKSNMLISMLHALGIEAYFVLVPKHIFVIVPLDDERLDESKGLWINERKYYILETTAKGSVVGYPLKYQLDEIDIIIEPFSNKKVKFKTLEYKL